MCNEHHHQKQRDEGWRCCPQGGQVRRFIRAWLLLLLSQKAAHGYELMERLDHDEDAPGADPGLLYRTLRQFEEDELVRSSWDTEGGGPARRVYEISDGGIEYLHTWAVNIRRTRERLDRFLAEYETHFQP